MDKTPIPKLLVKLAPPVMLSLLIQSFYNLADSFFIGRYSEAGLQALSIIYPVQLLITALATGTAAGAGILLSRADGAGEKGVWKKILCGTALLGVFHWLLFALFGLTLLRPFFTLSSLQPKVCAVGISYGKIVTLLSLGTFLQSGLEKLMQARGKMTFPMAGQIIGALVNIVLDPILIFGAGSVPPLGMTGAAIATVTGQWCALLVTLLGFRSSFPREKEPARTFSVSILADIYRAAAPSILMQALYTLYIVGLNLILKGFTEDAITVLGIYYKLQTFFFIPMMGLQQVILPIVSHNYGAGRIGRTKETLRCSVYFSVGVMALATMLFMLFPAQMAGIFTSSPAICAISRSAFRIISVSFIPAAVIMMLTVYFQGVSLGSYSSALTVLRQVILLIPLAWLFHFAGLSFTWLTFPVTEFITLTCGIRLYQKQGTNEKRFFS